MKVAIFCNGYINDYQFINKHLRHVEMVICSDGGLRHAAALDVWPHHILGDFDSVDTALLEAYRAKGACIHTFPSEKDFTDAELAITFAVEKNATEIVIFGGLGNRMDHCLGNIHVMLQALKHKVHAMMINENHIIQLMTGETTLYGNKGDIISLIPLTTEVTGICTEGLAYPLHNETLTIGFTRGISNVLMGHVGTITTGTGILIVIQARD